MATLHAIFQVELHIVAQVVEAELIVGSIGHVRGVGIPALLVIKIMNNDADRKTQKTVKLAHPLRVAFGKIVIDCDNMHAAAA